MIDHCCRHSYTQGCSVFKMRHSQNIKANIRSSQPAFGAQRTSLQSFESGVPPVTPVTWSQMMRQDSVWVRHQCSIEVGMLDQSQLVLAYGCITFCGSVNVLRVYCRCIVLGMRNASHGGNGDERAQQNHFELYE